MSKIYDALRKAERDRGRPQRRKPPSPEGAGRALKRGAPAGRTREAAPRKGFETALRASAMNLRNAIDSEMKQGGSRVVMITSSVEGEGKTSILAVLARIIAVGEAERVLLVDCSVDNPELHGLFGIPNEDGILDYLSGAKELDAVVHTLEEGVLDLVPLGSIPNMEMTQQLFNSDRMEFFVKTVGETYDYVLIDSSSVLQAPETAIIGSFVDGIVMVIQSASTKREVIKRAIMRVTKMEGTLLGTVLNRKKYYIPDFIYKRV